MMLHWEIVSGSKQHKAIRKMRNRFKTDQKKKKTLSKEKQKTNNEVLVFFFFSLFFLREAARFFRPILFFSLQNKTKKISRPPGAPADLSQRFTEFLTKPIENLSKTIFFCQDEPSLWKPSGQKKPCTDCLCIPSPLLLLQRPPLLLPSQLKWFWRKLKQKRLEKKQKKKQRLRLDFGNVDVWDLRAGILVFTQ